MNIIESKINKNKLSRGINIAECKIDGNIVCIAMSKMTIMKLADNNPTICKFRPRDESFTTYEGRMVYEDNRLSFGEVKFLTEVE